MVARFGFSESGYQPSIQRTRGDLAVTNAQVQFYLWESHNLRPISMNDTGRFA